MALIDNKQILYPLSGSFTGSLYGTASYALDSLTAVSSSYALTSSYSNDSTSASYALSSSTTISSSYALTASYVLDAISSSYALTASYALSSSTTISSSYALTSSTAISSSYALTSSFAPNYLPLSGGTINGNVTVNGTASIAFLNVIYESASVIYSSGSNQLGDEVNDTQTLIGTVKISGSLEVTGSAKIPNITGSLFGTASYANNSLSASFASRSLSATSSSYALTSSHALNSISSSYALTASYALSIPSSSIVFANNIIVSLSGGKTLGRYVNGDTIPSAGKTSEQVLNLIAQEPINPTVNLSSPTSIAFNQTAISNVLNFSYVINTLGASVSTVLLEWRRNNSGAWTTLTTNTALITFTHTLTDSAFNTQPFNYRYTVTDTAGATTTVTFNITPAAYVAPSITFSAPASTLGPIDSNTIREKGNTSSVLQGVASRNSINVPISGYTFNISINGGGYINIASGVLGTSGGVFTNYTDTTANSSANTVVYRVDVTDSYTTTSAYYTIVYKNILFYGPSATIPSTSSDVRALPNLIFMDGSNPFTLNTGTTDINFTAALLNGSTITQVLDLDALNANITANYILNNFNVNDAGGTATSYNVYTMTNAVPYSSNHRHQITRS